MISYGQEDRTSGAYGSISHEGHRSDKDDTVRDGRFLDTHDRKGSGYRFYSSSGSDRYHGHHHYHPYRMSERVHFLDEFNKAKPPTFDGELKKPEDVGA